MEPKLYLDIIRNICKYVNIRSFINLLSISKQFVSFRNDDLFTYLLQDRFPDLRLITYGLKISSYKLYKELHQFSAKLTGNYSTISLNELYNIFIKAIELNSLELLIFSTSNNIIPTSKYHRYLKILLRSDKIPLYWIISKKLNNYNSHTIKMIEELIKAKVEIPGYLGGVTDDSTIIEKLILDPTILRLFKVQLIFNYDFQILKRVSNLEVLKYYLQGLNSTFSCDTFLIQSSNREKVELILKSDWLIINNMELVVSHLINLRDYPTIEYLFSNKVEKISIPLINKMKRRKCQFLSTSLRAYDLK